MPTHREGSIMGWITNETHGEFAVTMKAIVEMTCSLTTEPRLDPQAAFLRLPLDPRDYSYSGGSFPGKSSVIVIDHGGGLTSAERRAIIKLRSDAGLPLGAFHAPRKYVAEGRQMCSAKDCVCLEGLNGKCVACGTME